MQRQTVTRREAELKNGTHTLGASVLGRKDGVPGGSGELQGAFLCLLLAIWRQDKPGEHPF